MGSSGEFPVHFKNSIIVKFKWTYKFVPRNFVLLSLHLLRLTGTGALVPTSLRPRLLMAPLGSPVRGRRLGPRLRSLERGTLSGMQNTSLPSIHNTSFLFRILRLRGSTDGGGRMVRPRKERRKKSRKTPSFLLSVTPRDPTSELRPSLPRFPSSPVVCARGWTLLTVCRTGSLRIDHSARRTFRLSREERHRQDRRSERETSLSSGVTPGKRYVGRSLECLTTFPSR